MAFDKAAAKKAGYSDSEINAYLAKKTPQKSVTQGDWQSKKLVGGDNIASNIVNSLADPFVKTGKTIGGGLFEIGRAGVSAAGNKNAYVNQKTGKQVENPFLTKDELNKYSTDPFGALMDQIKASAGVASYGVPVGGAAKVAGKTFKPGVFKGGALAGGLFGASKDDATPQSITTDALTGGVMGKILPKALGIGKKVEGAGKALRKSVLKPDVQPGPFYTKKTDEMLEKAGKAGLKGSAQAQLSQIPQKYTDLTNKITQKLATVKKPVPFASVVDDLGRALDNNINYHDADPLFAKAKAKFLNQLTKHANKGKAGIEITPKALFEFKQHLGKQLNRAYSRLDKGNPLSPAEEVGITFYDSLKDILNKNVKGISDLTEAQHAFHEISKGLVKSTQQTVGASLPSAQLYFPGLNRPFQSLQDSTGRGLMKAGQAGEKISNAPLISILTNALKNPNVAARTPQMQGSGGQPQQMSEPSGDVQGAATTIEEPEIMETEETSGELEITPEMVSAAYVMFPKDVADRIKAAFQLQGGKDSAFDEKRKAAVSSADVVYNQLSELALNAPAGWEGAAGAFFGQIPGVEGGSAEDLKRVTEGYAKAIAAAFAGEVGVATDEDVIRWLGLMPKPGDTHDERVRALQRLREQMDAEKVRLGVE